MGTTRFGVSMDEELLGKLDAIVDGKAYPNRSEAIRDLIRSALVEQEWTGPEGEIIGVLVIVFDHHKRELSSRLLKKEHDWKGSILSTLHLHIDHDSCLEVKVIKGEAPLVRAFADELISMKGIKYGKLIRATAGRGLK
jgi:CopG family nickel-responsive transcriptional regulator